MEKGLGTLGLLCDKAWGKGNREDHDRLLYAGLDLLNQGVSLKAVVAASHLGGPLEGKDRLDKARRRRKRDWIRSGNKSAEATPQDLEIAAAFFRLFQSDAERAFDRLFAKYGDELAQMASGAP